MIPGHNPIELLRGTPPNWGSPKHLIMPFTQKEFTATCLRRIFKDVIPNMLKEYYKKLYPFSKNTIVENINDDRQIIKIVLNDNTVKGDAKMLLHNLLDYSNKFAHYIDFPMDYIKGLLSTMRLFFCHFATNNKSNPIWLDYIEAENMIKSLMQPHPQTSTSTNTQLPQQPLTTTPTYNQIHPHHAPATTPTYPTTNHPLPPYPYAADTPTYGYIQIPPQHPPSTTPTHPPTPLLHQSTIATPNHYQHTLQPPPN